MSPRTISSSSSVGRAAPEAAGQKPAPGLYLVATPIGNLGDISLRALDLLAMADAIACEDTRVARKLFAVHGIGTRPMAYHEHNAERIRPRLIEMIKCGKSVALISDAGTPLISDPGHKLVKAVIAEGLAVTALPGPSAALAALLVSGLPSDRFFFAGFLPAKAAARRRALGELASVRASLVIFESARRLASALEDMAALLGPRPAAVARELTKLHEEVRRDTLVALAAHYRRAGPPKGEVVVVIAPPEAEADRVAAEALDISLRAAMKTASLRDAAAAVAGATGLPRRRIYARALELQQSGEFQQSGPGTGDATPGNTKSR